MKIHLIVPSRHETKRPKPFAFVPPLGLAALAAVTPPGIEVLLTDESLDPIDFAMPADLVGITSTTQTVARAYQVADTFRSRGVKVVLGGLHSSVLPEEAKLHADAVVIGEAERTWPEVISDFESGELKPFYRNPTVPELAGLPAPRREIYKRRRYLLPDTVYTTRGCPYDCTFCSVKSIFGETYRRRPVGEVIREIDGLKNRSLIMIVDDNINGHRAYALKLFQAMAGLKLRWIGQASITIARDQSLLAAAAASGCTGLFLGIETLSPANLESVGKRHHAVNEYEDAIGRIHAHGINVYGSFLFGLDEDTEDVFEATVRFAQRTRLEAAQFSILTPYPGTPLMATLEREGRILTKNWEEYREDRVVFIPRHLSPRRLMEGREWAWREFYRLSSIWDRIGLNHSYAPVIWAMNLQYRSDRFSKFVFDRFTSFISPLLRSEK